MPEISPEFSKPHKYFLKPNSWLAKLPARFLESSNEFIMKLDIYISYKKNGKTLTWKIVELESI